METVAIRPMLNPKCGSAPLQTSMKAFKKVITERMKKSAEMANSRTRGMSSRQKIINYENENQINSNAESN